MKTIGTVIFLALFAAPAQAQQGGAADQQRCSAEANQKKLKGDERQSFMSSCVAMAAQKVCNQRARDRKLKADARRKFMTECLRG